MVQVGDELADDAGVAAARGRHRREERVRRVLHPVEPSRACAARADPTTGLVAALRRKRFMR